MIAVLAMCMIMYPACAVIAQVGPNNSNDSKRKKPVLVFVPYLFCYKEGNSNGKNEDRRKTVMMPAVAMPEGIGANNKGQEYHEVFKTGVMNDIHTQNGEGTQDQGQDSAMYSTGYRCCDP